MNPTDNTNPQNTSLDANQVVPPTPPATPSYSEPTVVAPQAVQTAQPLAADPGVAQQQPNIQTPPEAATPPAPSYGMTPQQFMNTPPTPQVASNSSNKLRKLVLVVAAVAVLGIVVAFAIVKLTSKKSDSQADNTTSSQKLTSADLNSTGQAASDDSKTTSAVEAAKQAMRLAELYNATNNAYPTKQSQVDAKSSGITLATSKITTAPADPKTVEFYVCKSTNKGYPELLKAGYWDYGKKTVVYQYEYASAEKYITTCNFIVS